MTEHPIRYFLPTSRAFDGTKRVLFQPFELGKWFVLGFSAWLAGLLDGNGGGGGTGVGGDQTDGGPAESFLRGVADWAQQHMGIAILIGAVVLLVFIGLAVLLFWISSRGKFMFLDNVVHNRARVRIPWNQFRAQGNSLCLWRLVFAAIAISAVLIVVGAFAVPCVMLRDSRGWLLALAGCGIAGTLALVLALIYVGILLEDFVIPLMYRDSLTTNQAWGRFLAVHRYSPGHFVRYALWKVVLGIAALVAIVLVGIGTCGLGILLMIIPYIGTVFLLPVLVFFRFLGPEFLRQFGGDCDILDSGAEAAK